jgi:hypothetical protein
MIRLYQTGAVDEIGQAFIDVSLELSSFEYQVFRDNLKVQEAYYDPYTKDPSIIESNLNKIESLL